MTNSQDFPPTEAITRRSMREAGKKKSAAEPSTGAVDPANGEQAAKPNGLSALVKKHPTAWLASTIAVVFLLLGTGAVFAGASFGTPPVAASTPSATPTPEPSRVVPAAVPVASRLRTCSVAALAADPRLEALSATVMNATTGEVLFDRNGTVHSRTASVLKVITGAAALSALGPDGRLTTRVLDGPTAGSIVLVGGGDATLATTSNTFYSGAPRIQDLASAAKAEYERLHEGVPITEIILDATMWDPSDNWDPTWNQDQRPKGHQPYITALMVDGDRQNPAPVASPRGDDPIGTAGHAFASALGVGEVTFTRAAASGGALLAEVHSQPVSTLIQQMLPSSDNTIAEMLARVSSKALGFNGSAASLAQAIPQALEAYGVDATGIVIKDGSGLSTANAVSPQFVAQLMVKVMNGDGGLAVVRDAMPVAGKNGTLSSRFSGDNAIARGSVVAKTGWLRSAYTLGGFMTAQDGTKLTFAIYATRDAISENAKDAIDTLTTGAFVCGDNLSNL